MAFDTARARIEAVAKAGGTLDQIQSIYRTAKALQAKLALYQAGTDVTFNAAFNAVFDVVGDRNAIADMIGDLNALIADWESTHADVLAGA
jgi:hypothetical protein